MFDKRDMENVYLGERKSGIDDPIIELSASERMILQW